VKRSHRKGPFWSIVSATTAATVIAMSGVNVALMDTGQGNPVELALGLALGVAAVALAAVLVWIFLGTLLRLPLAAASAIGGAVLALWILKANGPATVARMVLDTPSWSIDLSQGLLSPLSLTGLVLTTAFIAAWVTLLARGTFPTLKIAQKGLLIAAGCLLSLSSIATLVGIMTAGSDPYPYDGATPDTGVPSSNPGNPAAPGSYEFDVLTYGAGNNPRRPEFGDERDMESRVVDARKILPEWKTFKAATREKYWGFGLREAPLNGHVWMPKGPGPFPLVLIVHGNHGMEDYSDDGYAYLAEVLASRGFIAVSVDQNYINGTWSGDFRGKEMAARGWLLLEHLALFKDWNQSPGHRLESKVDMENIALIGHSRGGEAVSIAHSFNALSHFPDDATVKFDYGFNIKALVAIAQVDQRYHRRVQLRDVDFFGIHGSYDADEPAEHGLRQMNRIGYSGKRYGFKAGVYLHGANHGQFNSGWGRYDYGPPGAWTLNTAPIIPGEEQRAAAAIYLSAFLEASLHEDARFLDYLKDPRTLAQWLPERTYVHQFADSSFQAFADFQEDIDVTTGSRPGSVVKAEGLSLWREEALLHRDNRPQGSNAVVLGWREPGASYTVETEAGVGIDEDRSLVFAVSGSLEALSGASKVAGGSAKTSTEAPSIADFSISLLTRDGQKARVRASQFAQLIPPVRVQYLKTKKQNIEAYNANWEPVLQYVEIPFNAFATVNPELSLEEVTQLRFDFDQENSGVLIFDNIGSALTTLPIPPKVTNAL